MGIPNHNYLICIAFFFMVLKLKSPLKQSVCIFLVIVLFSSPIFSQQDTESNDTYTIYKNLKFVETKDEPLTLDLFIPNKIPKNVPCIIVIQGGGFKSQDGQRFRHEAEYIAENHYAAALISYRGRPEYTYETTIEDVKSAVRFIRSVSNKYAIDPDKIGATGRSAGGTLAALLAVTGNESYEKKNDCDSTSILAAVAFAGVFDFISRFTESAQIDLQPKINSKIASNSEWIGSNFSEHNQSWEKVSAINYVDKNDPPILFMHCKDDQVVPWIQSQDMFDKMNGVGINSEVLYFEKGGHGFQTGEKEDYLRPMISFFKKQFE